LLRLHGKLFFWSELFTDTNFVHLIIRLFLLFRFLRFFLGGLQARSKVKRSSCGGLDSILLLEIGRSS
jgi:hypothetical protein